MSPEDQRIAIAEACGLKPQDIPLVPAKANLHGWFTPDGALQMRNTYPNGISVKVIPDYLNDLNAMHEAEKVLDGPTDDEESQRAKYAEHLTFICAGNTEPVDVWYWDHIHATAAQRAEAFLRTIGKWQEQPQEQSA